MSRWIVIATTVVAFAFVWFSPDTTRADRISVATSEPAPARSVADEAREFLRSISFSPARKPNPDGISEAEAIQIALARGQTIRQARAEGRELSELEIAAIGVDAPRDEPESSDTEGVQVASIDAKSDFDLLETDGSADEPTEEAAVPEPTWRITGSNVNLRAGPGTEHSVLTQAGLDDRVEPLTDPSDAWVQVRLADTGETAWIFAQFIARDF